MSKAKFLFATASRVNFAVGIVYLVGWGSCAYAHKSSRGNYFDNFCEMFYGYKPDNLKANSYDIDKNSVLVILKSSIGIEFKTYMNKDLLREAVKQNEPINIGIKGKNNLEIEVQLSPTKAKELLVKNKIPTNDLFIVGKKIKN
jgi:hypothetical protein